MQVKSVLVIKIFKMDVENAGKINRKEKKEEEGRNKIVLLCENPSPMNLVVLKTMNNEVSRLVDINHCTHVCGYFLCSTRLFVYSFIKISENNEYQFYFLKSCENTRIKNKSYWEALVQCRRRYVRNQRKIFYGIDTYSLGVICVILNLVR